MDTILHIGLPKTGTTTVEWTLKRSRKYLLERGVLYPTNPSTCSFASHKILASIVLPEKSFGRDLRSLSRDGNGLLRIQDEFVNGIVEQCAQLHPKRLIISAEHLSNTNVRADKLQDFLQRVNSSAVRSVVYCRRPSRHFVSRAQQWMKGSYYLPVYKKPVLEILEHYCEMFGEAAVDVNVFDPETLIGGDIVRDFCARYLQTFGVEKSRLSAIKSANETISAESMVILLEFRKAFHYGASNSKSEDSRSLLRILKVADAAAGALRPSLLPEMADRIDYSDASPLILRDRFGVEFPNYDYARLERGELLEPPQKDLSLSELLVLDHEMLKDIVYFVERSDWVADSARQTWLRERFKRDG